MVGQRWWNAVARRASLGEQHHIAPVAPTRSTCGFFAATAGSIPGSSSDSICVGGGVEIRAAAVPVREVIGVRVTEHIDLIVFRLGGIGRSAKGGSDVILR